MASVTISIFMLVLKVMLKSAPNLGISNNLVVKLTEIVPEHVNHKIFFVNWFKIEGLYDMLPLGTVRLNRLSHSYTLPEIKLKKAQRSYARKDCCQRWCQN